MKNFKDYIDIAVAISALVAIVYRLFQVESKLYQTIDKLESKLYQSIAKIENNIYQSVDVLKDDLSRQISDNKHESRIEFLDLTNKISENKHKIDLHLVEWREKREDYEHRFHGLQDLIKHKFERLAHWIAQIGNFLAKETGFTIRDDKY